jgi:cation transport ATPase
MTRAAAQVALAVLGLLAGGVCHLAGVAGAGDVLWQATIVVTVVPVTVAVVRGMAQGDFGVDIIALLAMAAALVGGELLAGAIVAVMLTGGDALEDYAAGRARRDLTALLRRAPQVARRRVGDAWEETAVDAVEAGDVLLVRAGEVVPADGALGRVRLPAARRRRAAAGGNRHRRHPQRAAGAAGLTAAARSCRRALSGPSSGPDSRVLA